MNYKSFPNPPVFDRKGFFVYFPNNKSGQTSVTGGSKGTNKKGALASRCIVRKAHPIKWWIESKRKHKRALKFTIVRHPYNRFLSTFKFLKSKCSESANIKFNDIDEFIELIKEHGEFHPTLHKQWYSSFSKNSFRRLVDRILYLENIEEDWKKIRFEINAKPFPRLNPSYSENCRTLLTYQHRKFIREYYSLDFDLFNFSE